MSHDPTRVAEMKSWLVKGAKDLAATTTIEFGSTPPRRSRWR